MKGDLKLKLEAKTKIQYSEGRLEAFVDSNKFNKTNFHNLKQIDSSLSSSCCKTSS